MAGPSVSILARLIEPYPSWRDVLTPSVTSWNFGDSCGVSNTIRIGGTYASDERPFVGSIEPFIFDADEFPDDAAISDAVRQCTGIEWTHSIVVAAMCNQPQDHRILCELAIDIAIRVGGIIDFDRIDAPIDSGLRRCDWTFGNDDHWTLLGTPEEARKWLANSRFHMSK